METIIYIAIVIAMTAAGYYIGSKTATKKTARKWAVYIMEKCVRLDLLTTRIQTEFDEAKKQAPEGMPIVIAQDTLLRIISEVVALQNK